MSLTICILPIVDGEPNLEKCYTRPAQLLQETIVDDDTGADVVVDHYSLPRGRTLEEFTVTDLSLADAEALAARLCDRRAAANGGDWQWSIEA